MSFPFFQCLDFDWHFAWNLESHALDFDLRLYLLGELLQVLVYDRSLRIVVPRHYYSDPRVSNALVRIERICAALLSCAQGGLVAVLLQAEQTVARIREVDW